MGKKTKKANRLADEEGKKKNKKKRAKALKAKSKQASAKSPAIAAAERYEMVATAAYYLAEKHGFDPRLSAQDWEQAEREIDAQFADQV